MATADDTLRTETGIHRCLSLTEAETALVPDYMLWATWRHVTREYEYWLPNLTARQDHLLTVVLCLQAYSLFDPALPADVRYRAARVLPRLSWVANGDVAGSAAFDADDPVLIDLTLSGPGSFGRRLAGVCDTLVGGGRPARLALRLFEEAEVPPMSWAWNVLAAVVPAWTFDPAWRTQSAVGLAGRAYDHHDWQVIPVLADALEDAGCADARVLDYLRGPGPFFRGCHILDELLGKR